VGVILNFSRIEKNKAALYGIKAVSPNSYAKGEERPYGIVEADSTHSWFSAFKVTTFGFSD